MAETFVKGDVIQYIDPATNKAYVGFVDHVDPILTIDNKPTRPMVWAYWVGEDKPKFIFMDEITIKLMHLEVDDA